MPLEGDVATGRRAPFPRRPWSILLPLVGVLGVLALVVVFVLQAAGPVRGDLSAEPSDGSTPHAVSAQGVRAEVVAPTGWIVMRQADDRLVVTSPDGVLTAVLEPRTASPREEVTALLVDAGAPLTEVRSETLADGRELLHADLADGTVYAAVALSRGSVSVVVTIGSGGDPAVYRPALAALLAGISP